MKSLKMCANGCDAPVCSPSPDTDLTAREKRSEVNMKVGKYKQVEERLAELMSEYVDREADGTAPPVEEFLGSCPDVAAELRPLLHTSARLSRAAQTIRPVGSADAAFNKIQAKMATGSMTLSVEGKKRTKKQKKAREA